MRKRILCTMACIVLLSGLLCSCSSLDSASPEEEKLVVDASETVTETEGGEDTMSYDFSVFKNVEISGAILADLNEEELSVLYVQARYCQAMTDADIDTMREIISEDMIFTHMSGRQQTREEYFADIEKGRLNYFTIGIENPVIEINGDTASITYTSVLNANAYGARGTYRMSGTHHYERRDGEWIAVNR